MTSHHFRHILFVRSQSLGPARTPGQGRTQRHKSEVTGIIGGILEAANHTPLPQYCSLFSLTLDISGLHFSLCVCSVLVSLNTPAHSACIYLLLPLHCATTPMTSAFKPLASPLSGLKPSFQPQNPLFPELQPFS